MDIRTSSILVCATLGLAGCEAGGIEGTRAFTGPNDYIAVANDLGRDSALNVNDNAGIAVLPDGCQAWVIDDGLEGRASNRLDPVSGLPVCAGEPGVVYGDYRSGTEGIPDRVPGDPLNTRTEYVQVRSVDGTYRWVHPRELPHH